MTPEETTGRGFLVNRATGSPRQGAELNCICQTELLPKIGSMDLWKTWATSSMRWIVLIYESALKELTNFSLCDTHDGSVKGS